MKIKFINAFSFKVILLFFFFCFGILSGFSQIQTIAYKDIDVPQEMEFAGVRLLIDDYARNKIKTDAQRLLKSEQHFNILIARIFRFFPVMEKILQEENIPEDFKFLAVQESALQADAVSTSNAVGYWQFKQATAMEMGLIINDNIDERKNIVNSTRSAARYLKRNNFFTKNWVHTLLSYNLGLTGVRARMKDNEIGTDRMDIDGNTHWYVLRCLAHKLVLQDALKNRPKNLISLLIHSQANGMTLKEVSEEMNISLETIKLYNKWLICQRVPEDKIYNVIIPVDYQSVPVVANKIPPPPDPNLFPKEEPVKMSEAFLVFKKNPYTTVVKTNKIGVFLYNDKEVVLAQNGDNFQKLADRGSISLKKFLAFNDIDISDKAIIGQAYYLKKKSKTGWKEYYTVQSGETIWQVAQINGIKLDQLLHKNRMGGNEKLQTGRILYLQKRRHKDEEVKFEKVMVASVKKMETKKEELVVPKKKEILKIDTIYSKPYDEEKALSTNKSEDIKSDKPILNEDLKLTDDKADKIHIVADKETLFSIARQYNTTVTNLKDWNNLTETEGIKAGQKLEIKTNTIQPSKLVVPTGITEHIVQPGESLFKIAWNYNTTVQEILDLNGKTETKIRVGEKLKIKGNSKN